MPMELLWGRETKTSVRESSGTFVLGPIPLGVGVLGLDLVAGGGVHEGDLGVDRVQSVADGVHKGLHTRSFVNRLA